MTEQRPPSTHPAPAYTHSSARHHPYAPPRHSAANGHHAPLPHHQTGSQRRPSPNRGPPSPARSRRDDDSPPLESKFEQGDSFWEDVPAAPASLKTILDSFRRSGEGDRDLLLSILGAKKSEEERLTAIIQTRLTVLQARLNLSAMQAQAQLAMPSPRQERTPSFTSQPGAVNQPSQHYTYPAMREHERGHDIRDREELRLLRERERDDRERELRDRERLLRAPVGYERERERGERLPPITDERRYTHSPRRRSLSASGLEPDARERDMREREREPREDQRERGDRRAGLDMLLEGVREAERETS